MLMKVKVHIMVLILVDPEEPARSGITFLNTQNSAYSINNGTELIDGGYNLIYNAPPSNVYQPLDIVGTDPMLEDPAMVIITCCLLPLLLMSVQNLALLMIWTVIKDLLETVSILTL